MDLYNILRFSLSTKFGYAMRVTPPSDIAKIAARADRQTMSAYLHLLDDSVWTEEFAKYRDEVVDLMAEVDHFQMPKLDGSASSIPTIQRARLWRAFLSPKLGGAGLTSVSLIAKAAYAASLDEAKVRIAEIVCGGQEIMGVSVADRIPTGEGLTLSHLSPEAQEVRDLKEIKLDIPRPSSFPDSARKLPKHASPWLGKDEVAEAWLASSKDRGNKQQQFSRPFLVALRRFVVAGLVAHDSTFHGVASLNESTSRPAVSVLLANQAYKKNRLDVTDALGVLCDRIGLHHAHPVKCALCGRTLRGNPKNHGCRGVGYGTMHKKLKERLREALRGQGVATDTKEPVLANFPTYARLKRSKSVTPKDEWARRGDLLTLDPNHNIDVAFTTKRLDRKSGVITSVAPYAAARLKAKEKYAKYNKHWKINKRWLGILVVSSDGGINRGGEELVHELCPKAGPKDFTGARYVFESLGIANVKATTWRLNRIRYGVPASAADPEADVQEEELEIMQALQQEEDEEDVERESVASVDGAQEEDGDEEAFFEAEGSE